MTEELPQQPVQPNETQAEHALEIDGTLLGISRDYSHEISAPGATGSPAPFVEPGFVTKRAADIVRVIISRVVDVVAEGALSPEDERWAQEQIDTFYKRIESAETELEQPIAYHLTQNDIREAVFFVIKLLLRRHPNMTTTEIQNLIEREDKALTLLDEAEAARLQDHGTQEKFIRGEAAKLYSAKYDWAYYPELVEELGLTGDKTENRLKVEAEEARLLATLNIPANEVDYHIALIREKMRGGMASGEESRFYKLSRNRRRVNWFTNILAPLEEIAACRGGRLLELWKEMDALARKVKQMKEVLSEEDRLITEEQLGLMGRKPSEAEFKTSAGEMEIRQGERIINEIFFELYHESYPDAVRRIQEGTIEINREKLEEILGINKE